MQLRRAALGSLVASAAFSVLQLGACSSDDSSPASAPDAAEDAPRDRNPPPEDVDAGVDAPVRPPPVVPPCVAAASIAMNVSGERVYTYVDMGPPDGGAPADAGDAGDADAGGDAGSLVGNFLLDFGSNGSTIDLDAFDQKPAPGFCNGDAGAPGARCNFPNFDFFGPWGVVELVTADYSFLFNTVKQAGIIGTDFLAVFPVTFDFGAKKIHKGSTTAFCTDAQLIAAGYTPLPSAGFYTSDTSKLRPLSDVITTPDAGVQNFTVPNVPTVPIAIGGVPALAQIDTGFDDRLQRHSVNINQALFDQIQANKPGLLTRLSSKDIFLTTCISGAPNQPAQAYKLADGTSVDFLAEGGAVGRADTGTFVYVKQSTADSIKCGGIETWTVPAAQMGASFIVDAQAAIFDPKTSRVWLPK